MLELDKKEQLISTHFKNIIEKREFDEYDIYGFLIFIREHIKSESKVVIEFCDLIAHRKRNQGIVKRCIEVAESNNYKTIPNTNIVSGYKGIRYDMLKTELECILELFGIDFSDDTIKEIVICIFSLTQFSKYEWKDGVGEIILSQGKGGKLSLYTDSGKKNSLRVCFSELEGIDFKKEFSWGIIDLPVETTRKDGKLRLFDGTDYII